MECLNCSEVFESDNPRKQFCSGKCKVAYHRKKGKKEAITKFDLKILYNEILDLAQKLSSGQIIAQPQKGYDAPTVAAIQNEQRWQNLKRRKTVEEYVLQKRELDCDEDYKKWLDELMNDSNLSDRQKQLAKSS